MIEKIENKNYIIVQGPLHDQKLIEVKQEENKLIFTFKIELYENDYNAEFYNKYKKYNYCDMIVKEADDPINYFELVTALNKRNEFKGKSLSKEEFIRAIIDCEATFIECTANNIYIKFAFAVSFYNSKQHKKYRKYDICNIEINYSDTVEWQWRE